jgi:hypothetical protein
MQLKDLKKSMFRVLPHYLIERFDLDRQIMLPILAEVAVTGEHPATV